MLRFLVVFMVILTSFLFCQLSFMVTNWPTYFPFLLPGLTCWNASVSSQHFPFQAFRGTWVFLDLLTSWSPIAFLEWFLLIGTSLSADVFSPCFSMLRLCVHIIFKNFRGYSSAFYGFYHSHLTMSFFVKPTPTLYYFLYMSSFLSK